MTSYALLFPGQGSQYVGMGKSFLANDKCVRLFEEADDILSLPLSRLMLDGPVEDLISTEFAQPAILLHSLVAFYFLKEELSFDIACALGHSLGEYSALVSAGVLNFQDALKAVHIRGKLMQQATPKGFGAMAAVIGLSALDIATALEEFGDEKSASYASCANFNGPSQTVIAGTKIGINQASEKLKSLGAKKIVELPVSAPFHCALMKPVQIKMAEVLNALQFNDAQFPIISNVNAQVETSGNKLRELLLLQIAEPVRFTDCINRLLKQNLRGDGYVEFGPKNTLSGIVRKIDIDALTLNVDAVDDLARFKRGYGEF